MTGYRLGRIFGIEVHIHGSWLVIGALVLWTLAANALPADYPEIGGGLRLLMAVIITTGFFVSLLAHELAHSVVAMARGIPVRRITFFLFGGMAQTSADSRSAGEEFLIAIAGPVMSFMLGGLFFALWLLGAGGAAPSGGAGGGWSPIVVGSAAYLAVLNLILGAFNLLPGFPMDGGRVLRAIIWKVTGDVTRATQWASRVGAGMAVVLMGYGLWEILNGQFISGVWMILIGMFIRNAARASYRHHLVTRMQDMAQRVWEGHRHRYPEGHRGEPPSGPAAAEGQASRRDQPQQPGGHTGWPPTGRDVTGLSGDG